MRCCECSDLGGICELLFWYRRYGNIEGLPLKDVAAELQHLSKSWSEGATNVPVGGQEGECPDDVVERGGAGMKQVIVTKLLRNQHTLH